MLNSHPELHRSTINHITPNLLTRRTLFAAIALTLGYSAQAATFSVTNTNDSGFGSLYQAVSNANVSAGADTIIFENTLINSTITLTSGEIEVTDDLTVTGPVTGNASSITLDGNNDSRLFHVTDKTVSLTLENLTLTQGESNTGSGGAIIGGRLTLSDSVVINNVSKHPGIGSIAPRFHGGGLAATTITLNRSTVSKNIAEFGSGGGLAASSIILNQSTVSDNTATGFGGGVYAGTLSVTQSTISGNSARGSGGGIFTTSFGSKIVQSTIFGNTSPFAGGASFNDDSPFSPTPPIHMIIENTIISGNTGTEGNVQVGRDNIILDVSNSVFGDPANEINGINIGNVFTNNPDLGPLQLNGGSLPTHLPNPGSPAVDSGDNLLAPGTVDQRGNEFTRIFNGIVDIGAVEHQPIPIRRIPVFSLPGLLALIASLTALVGWRQRTKPDKQR